jgi:hypothetical protein
MWTSQRASRCESKHRRSAVAGTLAVSAAAVFFLLPVSQAGAVSFNNACVNNLTGQASLTPTEMTATASPNPVSPGGSVTLSNIDQTTNVGPAIFLTLYRDPYRVLPVGESILPAIAQSEIAGTNIVPDSVAPGDVQETSTVSGSLTTTITDPTPANRNSGDESATPGTLSVSYPDQTWIAGASGTIEFREWTSSPDFFGTLIIDIGFPSGGGGVEFVCNPGEVVDGADPSAIVLTDPARSFAGTTIQSPSGVIDAAVDAIVGGPTHAAAGAKTVAARVTNLGTGPLQVSGSDVSLQILVNGAPTTGTVSALDPGTKTLVPGDSARFRSRWTFGSGEVSAGATVKYTACVTVAADSNTGNDCGSATQTAK